MPSWIKAIFAGKNAPQHDAQIEVAQLKKRGATLLDAGDLAGAEESYRRALSNAEGDAGAAKMLGFVLKEQGRADEAALCLERAVAIDPAMADAWYFLAELAQLRGVSGEAIALLRKALECDPAFEFAYRDLCRLFFQNGNAAQAKQILVAALAHFPDNAEFHFLLGNAYFDEGQAARAEASFRAALALSPSHGLAYANLAMALQSQSRLDEAMAALDAALAIDAGVADWHLKRGYLAQLQGDMEAALSSFRHAIALQPGFTLAHANLGSVLGHLGRFDEALLSYQTALSLEPQNPDHHFNLGALLQTQGGKLDEALAHYRDGLAIAPAHKVTLANMALVLDTQGRYDEALACYDSLIAHHPDMAQAHVNKGFLLLRLGRYPEGWREYEYRWQRDASPAFPVFSQPLWLGKDDLSGKTILLVGEQGFGDVLHFMRYAKLVAAQGARVYLQVPAALKTLAVSCPGVDEVFAPEDSLPPFDYFCPLMSLPLACQTTLDTVPNEVPYLFVSQEKLAQWGARLGAKRASTALRVGLAWAGDARVSMKMASMMDQQRSMHFKQLLSLLDVPNVEFFSLQVGARARSQLDGETRVADFTGELADFHDTAALIANLDLVISVDTSIVHVAGAIGKTVWMLDRQGHCYRWLLGREDSPWYPAMRIFRQASHGDWTGVIARVRQALLQHAAVAPDSVN